MGDKHWIDYLLNQMPDRDLVRPRFADQDIGGPWAVKKHLWDFARSHLHWRKPQFEEWFKSKGEIIPSPRKEPKARQIEKGIWEYPEREEHIRAFCRVGGGRLQFESFGGPRAIDKARAWRIKAAYDAKYKGQPQTHKGLKKILVHHVLDWYLMEYLYKTGQKDRYEWEVLRIGIACEHYMCGKPVTDVTREDVYDYINGRLQGIPKRGGLYRPGVDPATLHKELSVLRCAFNIAKRRKEEYKNIPNPFAGFNARQDYEYVYTPRERVLQKGELKKLLDKCETFTPRLCMDFALMIFLGLETGMREEEILRLRWKDIDFDERTILVTQTKTVRTTGKETRIIVLPYWSMYILEGVALGLRLELKENGVFRSDKYIFTTNESAFGQRFKKLVKKTELEEHLTFRDLRRTAASRFSNEVRLTEAEVGLMLGHIDKKNITRSVYIKTDLAVIREQLDRYVMKKIPLDVFVSDPEKVLKMPIDEAWKKIPRFTLRGQISLQKIGRKYGNTPEPDPIKADEVLRFVKEQTKDW
jgi:integrase